MLNLQNALYPRKETYLDWTVNLTQSKQTYLVLNWYSLHSTLQGFLKNSVLWVQNHLNFSKFKVALNPHYRIFLNFAKSWILSLGGGLPFKKDGGACWNFWKEPLRGTKILFCWHGLKCFSPLRGINSKTT